MDNGKDSPADDARVIEVSFANSSTKSTLDGLQPYFAAGDVIKVSNGSKGVLPQRNTDFARNTGLPVRAVSD